MNPKICPACALLRSHCLCPSAPRLKPRTQLLVLQHPAECHHPKNTLRLARLALPAMRVLRGERFPELAELEKHPRLALVYPAGEQDGVEPTAAGLSGGVQPDSLIFIDATWRKAHKLLMLNPWLQKLPRLALSECGNYRLRKTRVDGGLSTLEAIAYALAANEGMDPHPLLALQANWVTARLAQMPAEVKVRYES